MPQTCCPHCGRTNRFSEDDYGAETYCVSCAKLFVLPEAENAVAAVTTPPAAVIHESAAANRPAKRVFGISSDALEERVIREITCECGSLNKVQLADLEAGAIYCRSCGAALQVGEQLEADGTRRELAPPPPAPKIAAPKPRWRLAGTLVGVGTLTAIALSVFGIWRATARPYVAPETRLEIEGVAPEARVVSSEDAPPFDPARLKLQMIEALLGKPDVRQSLTDALSWRQALAEHKIPEDDPRRVRLAAVPQELIQASRAKIAAEIAELPTADDPKAALEVALVWARLLREAAVADDDSLWQKVTSLLPQLEERADPITLAMIQGLLQRSDTSDALLQARIWEDVLHDREAPDADSRFEALKQVAGKLRDRVARPATPPPEVERKFRDLVQKLIAALQKQDLAAAKATSKEIEAIAEAHGKELAPQMPRYLALKKRLRVLEARKLGPERIRKAFEEVENSLAEAAGKRGDADGYSTHVASAISYDARARHLVFVGPCQPKEIEEFNERVKKYEKELRLAKGIRAVLDAERCDQAKDPGARKLQADLAYAILPGLPEDEIRPWLARVSKWHEEKGTTPRPTTDTGWAIESRAKLEACYEQFARAQIDALVQSCLEAERLNQEKAHDPKLHDDLGKLLFDILELKLGGLMDPASETGDETKLAEELRSARLSLNQAGPWSDSPRWKALDAVVDQRAAGLVAAYLKQAESFAEQDNLPAAIEKANLVRDLAGAAQKSRAEGLVQNWQKQRALKESREAQQKSREAIERLAGDNRDMEALVAISKHEKTWPEGEESATVKELKQKLTDRVRPKLQQELDAIQRDAGLNKWPEVARRLPGVKAAAIDDQMLTAVKMWEDKLSEQRKRVQSQFDLLGAKKRLSEETDVPEVRRVCLLVLSVMEDPEASQLLTKANEIGSRRATELLRTANLYKSTKPDKYREKLEQAIRLDPDGEAGKQARGLLKAI